MTGWMRPDSGCGGTEDGVGEVRLGWGGAGQEGTNLQIDRKEWS